MALLVGFLGGAAALGVLVLAGAWTPTPAQKAESKPELSEMVMPLTAAIVIAALALISEGKSTRAGPSFGSLAKPRNMATCSAYSGG